jgi:hypothetical protein
MDWLIHPKIEIAGISFRQLLPQSPATLNTNCVALQKGFVPLQHAFALPQNPGGTFRNGGRALPNIFAPVQSASAWLIRNFAVLQNPLASLQKRFAAGKRKILSQ